MKLEPMKLEPMKLDHEVAVLLKANGEMQYLSSIPMKIPSEFVLVHNKVVLGIRPRRRPGFRGFRAWLQRPDVTKLEVCSCGWAPELSQHYRRRHGDA